MRHTVGLARGERQVVLRRIIGAIAYDLADGFGFQRSHTLAATIWLAAVGVRTTRVRQHVLSSVANQIDILVPLNRMDAAERRL